jgi:hypothetical protein
LLRNDNGSATKAKTLPCDRGSMPVLPCLCMIGLDGREHNEMPERA